MDQPNLHDPGAHMDLGRGAFPCLMHFMSSARMALHLPPLLPGAVEKLAGGLPSLPPVYLTYFSAL